MQTSWLSAHIFSTSGLNRVLYERVIPFLQAAGGCLQAPAPYFFIRYGEGGPHIRLRLNIRDQDTAAVKALFKKDMEVRFIPYLPEIERYGNSDTISMAEQQFYLCSAYVLSFVQQHPDHTASKTLVQAIQMNMAILYALQVTPDEVMVICTQFIRSWLPRLYDKQQHAGEQEAHFMFLLEERFSTYAGALLPAAADLWTALQRGQAAPFLQAYADKQLPLLRDYQHAINNSVQMRSIVCSLLHMQHNRLGVSNLDEAYIIFFTMKCMAYVYEQVH